ncbi:hypothetical protein A5731_08170 [Mycolicibacterium conceptionense]|jgi:hypothetical protein|uniref:Uncharacterized protein n=1 Tax=Mycolicibacterium conceptionense TaxID=451644 RepID=A0A0J8U4Z2_9MYCO|nr:hypothetical protein [Mycolicibacterium conceptionense]KMV16486.1 hypothetical protein ACT17_19945 [Mycolicibacterium conceptionense]OBB11435.1 hypothetical protein A5718_06545 [Mycolicibacterium conceptionense]OBF06967.1 hypothetical protein A5731_08170 [Mycolicibacterium conceptionense]OBF26616.1 hypothetical protein A5726_05455 [Mycolicibacterium conceptionense]OBF31139.1 hypothetical protein A5720_28680 [Mycolicibacterium conceptionense]
MVHLYEIVLIHQTGHYRFDGTDAAFKLHLNGPGGHRGMIVPDNEFEDDEREKGHADYYKMEVPLAPYDYDEQDSTVELEMTTDKDDWVPYAIYVLGRTVPDANQWVLLGAHDPWPREIKWSRRTPLNPQNTHVVSGFF